MQLTGIGATLKAKWGTIWSTFALLSHTNKKALLTSLVTGIGSALLYPILLLLIGYTLSTLLANTEKIQAFMQSGLWLVLALFGVLFLQQVFSSINETATILLRSESSKEINAQIMDKLAHTPYPLFEDNAFQSRYGLIIAEASYRPGLLVDSLLQAIAALVALLGILITLLAIAPLLVFLLLVVMLLIAVETRFHQRTLEMQTASAPELFRMQYLSQRSIDATWQRDMRVYRSEVLHDEYMLLSGNYMGKLRRLLWRFQGVRLVAAIIASVTIALATLCIFWLISGHIVAPAQAGILLSALYFGLMQGRTLSTAIGLLTECLSYIEKIFAFLDETVEQPSALLPENTVVGSVMKPEGVAPYERIILNDVTFVYANAARSALIDVSYEFPLGMTALVGPNGAGKSTMVKLLTGLLAPTSGKIEVIGPDGSRNTPERAVKAVLFQEPAHIHLSVRQNITLNSVREEDEEARIYAALEQAGLASVVRALPDGIDTLVGAGFGGRTDLSGGQWQRLALARLIYHDRPIIVLDEPIASLDPEGERSIFDLFTRLAQSRIIIFTTHRYDSIPASANIVVMVDGTLIESGTHEELLQKHNAYWSLLHVKH